MIVVVVLLVVWLSVLTWLLVHKEEPSPVVEDDQSLQRQVDTLEAEMADLRDQVSNLPSRKTLTL